MARLKRVPSEIGVLDGPSGVRRVRMQNVGLLPRFIPDHLSQQPLFARGQFERPTLGVLRVLGSEFELASNIFPPAPSTRTCPRKGVGYHRSWLCL